MRVSMHIGVQDTITVSDVILSAPRVYKMVLSTEFPTYTMSYASDKILNWSSTFPRGPSLSYSTTSSTNTIYFSW